ncbi:MAG: ThiF family adenylyltransferase, partial [Gemmatimonadales bacterium]|nr:ThiF family adenylyltransferase [Gemmatimonadales bacterium]
LSKVAYFRALYSRMRRGIVAHEEHVSEENVEVLLGFDFVFLCLDHGPAKKLIVDRLSTGAMSFIDVGIGVEMVPESLALWAICRVTTSTPDKRDHFLKRVSFADNDSDNAYDKNIQVADLNALNAALAVIKWKKLCGFYQDLEKEHNTTYTTSSNLLTSDDLL